MSGRTIVAGAAVCLVAGGAWMLAGSDPSEREPVRVHTDARAMESAVLDAIRALLRDDGTAVVPAVKRIEAGCRELHAEDDDALGSGFRQLDQALHTVLRGTRGYVADGDLDEAFTEFVWVVRTCRQCHAHARENGRLPADGVLWSAPTGATKSAETTRSGPDTP